MYVRSFTSYYSLARSTTGNAPRIPHTAADIGRLHRSLRATSQLFHCTVRSLPAYRNFTLASPRTTKIIEIIHSLATTRCSGHPAICK